MSKPYRFVSIGAGNVASHMVKHMCQNGYQLLQVYSRTAQSAKILADSNHTTFTISQTEINRDADFYLVSLPDQVLPEFLNSFPVHHKLIFHTAGSIGLEVFGSQYHSFGVLYPLQTFTKNVSVKFNEIPLLVEAGDVATLEEIKKIAGSLSAKVLETDSDTRQWIHLSAVFACNFTNHMFAVSSDILRSKNIDPAILTPLIEETFKKSGRMDPADAQTGPAVRNDTITMQKHINILHDRPLLQKIYTFTSESIQYLRASKHNNQGK